MFQAYQSHLFKEYVQKSIQSANWKEIKQEQHQNHNQDQDQQYSSNSNKNDDNNNKMNDEFDQFDSIQWTLGMIENNNYSNRDNRNKHNSNSNSNLNRMESNQNRNNISNNQSEYGSHFLHSHSSSTSNSNNKNNEPIETESKWPCPRGGHQICIDSNVNAFLLFSLLVLFFFLTK